MNQSFVHADFFFFVATIAVAVLALGLLIFFYYAIRTMRDVHRIASTLGRGAERLIEGIGALHFVIKEEGMKLRGISDFLAKVGSEILAIKNDSRKHSRRKKIQNEDV